MTIAGEDLSDQEKREADDLRRMKVHILNTYVFPSMANVTFFFKCIAQHPELEQLFEDDIKDLLGVRRNKPAEHIYGFMFFELVWSIIILSGKREHDKEDFRLRLNHLLQQIVCHKVEISLADVFRTERAQEAVSDDFNRVWAWTGMLADAVDQDEGEPRRTFDLHI